MFMHNKKLMLPRMLMLLKQPSFVKTWLTLTKMHTRLQKPMR